MGEVVQDLLLERQLKGERPVGKFPLVSLLRRIQSKQDFEIK